SWYNGTLGWNRQLPADFSNLALGAHGEHYHFRPWLLPILSTPLYWAFGLVGVLLFNVLCFGIAAFGIERFARHFVPGSPSALAALAVLLAMGPRARAYDYSVDVLLIALVALACAALVTRRGVVAGLLIGGAVLIKPPNILLILPCAALMWEQKDLRTLGRAVLGGAIALGLGAVANTIMFGRPWWFGYSRVLVVVDGVQTVASDADAFTTDPMLGLIDMWGGEWGVIRRWGAFAIGLIGAGALVRSRPRYTIATVVTLVGLFLLFSRFPWRFDRFLFGAFVVASPLVAVGLRTMGALTLRALRAIPRVRVRLRPAALLAAFVAVFAGLASFGTQPSLAGRLFEGRTPVDAAYVIGASQLGRSGALDLSEAPLGAAQQHGESSILTRSRFGFPVARAPLPAVLAGGLAFAIGGPIGMLLLHLALGALAVYFAAALGARAAPPWLAAVLAAGVSLAPPLASSIVAGGPGLFAAALVLGGGHALMRRRFVGAAIALGLGAFCADALLPVALAAVLAAGYRAHRRGGRQVLLHDTRAPALATAITLAVYGLGALAWIGRPFASPDDFVLLAPGGDPVEIARASFFAVLDAAARAPGPDRAGLVLVALAPFGLVAARRRALLTIFLLASALGCLVPGGFVSGGHLDESALLLGGALASIALGALARPLRRALRDATPKHAWVLVGAVAVGLLAVGAISRGSARSEPLRLASPLGVREAEVWLGDDVPCDFLAWELMSWECATIDGGGENRTGLRLPDGVRVGGRPRTMLLVPTAARRPSAPRRLRWQLEAGPTFVLRTAPADGPYDRDAAMVLRIDGEERARFQVPRGVARVEERRFDTRALEGRVLVEIEMRPIGRGSSAAVGVDGGFIDRSVAEGR
ncbi:MAG: hypothetical protein AB7P00_33940, partial [Sandaracinaceae bacterium]